MTRKASSPRTTRSSGGRIAGNQRNRGFPRLRVPRLRRSSRAAERADRASDEMRLRLLGLAMPMRGAIELENRHT